MNEYLDLLKATPGLAPSAPAAPANPYVDLLQNVEDQRRAQLNATVGQAVGTNPDELAKQRRVADYLGVSVGVVKALPQDAQRQFTVKQIGQDTANSPALQKRYNDADFAALAQDDSGVLSSIAAAAKYIFGHPDAKGSMLGDIGGGLYNASAVGTSGFFRAGAEYGALAAEGLFPGLRYNEELGVAGGNPLRRLAEGFAGVGREQQAILDARPKDTSFIGRSVSSGFQSLGQNAKYMPLAALGPAGAAAALTGMSWETGGQAYQDAREKGLTPVQALPFATSQAVIEYATEKIPMGRLLEGITAGAPVWKTIARDMAAEVRGEQVATILQDMNEWAVLPENKDKPFSAYLAERPSAAAQTLIATLIGAGGNVVVADTARASIDRMLGIQRGAAYGEADGKALQQLFALAAQSKLRERSPDTFAGLVQEMADEPGGVPSEVRFDARLLAGEGGTGGLLNQEQIASIPSLQAQLGEALATGGEVVVPIGELIALADSGVEKTLLENARVGNNELSQAEAKQAADQAETFLQQEAERVIATAKDVQAMQAGADQVRQAVYDQLAAAGRFTAEVNHAYSTLVRDFYTTMAGRFGMAPEEMYGRYPLRVQSTATDGTVLNDRQFNQGGEQALAQTQVKDRTGQTFDVKVSKQVFGYGQTAPNSVFVEVRDPKTNERRALIDFSVRDDGVLTAENTKVAPQYQKRGLAQAMYQAAREAGFDIAPGRIQTDQGLGMVEALQRKGVINKEAIGPRFRAGDLPLLNQSVSTRVPTAKKATENPLSQMLVVGLDASKADKSAFEKNVDLLTSYPNYREAPDATTPEQKAERFIEHVVSNLIWLHDNVDAATRNRSKLWYDGARAIADRWSAKFDLTDAQVSGVLAVLSPQKDWFMNVSLAERVISTMRDQQNTSWSPEMDTVAREILAKPQYRDDLAAITGKTLGELNDPVLKAMWIRVYDQAHNPRNYRLVTPEGGFGDWVTNADGKTKGKLAWGDFGSIAKAVRILEDGSIPNISANLGEQHKVRNFYNNIYDPADKHGSVTIDTHAVAAALLQPFSGSAPAVLQNFGGGGAASSSIFGSQGTYGIYAEAYRRAAEQRGVLPREMQSITWEAVRGLFTAGFKAQQKNVDAVAQVWENYKAERITLDEARQQLTDLAGGVNPPEWAGSDRGSDAGAGDSSYAAELAGASVPGGSAGPVAGRAAAVSSDQGIDGLDRFAGESPAFQQGPRGTFNPSTLTISLLESADLSTFLHETGHFFLEVMGDLAAQPNAPAGVVEDMGKLLSWFGVKDLATWNGMTLEQQRKSHEKFAESFEQYLLEGKAPSAELQPLFQRFRAWLTNVYRSLREFMHGHNTDLSPEVRQVFDRMLASESQIKEAEALRGYEPLFKSAAEVGMDPAAWAAYTAASQKATDDAIDTQQKRSLRDMRWAVNARNKLIKALQRDASAKRKGVEAEVAAEVAKQPIYQAMHWLRKGEMTTPKGEQIKAEKGFRLNTEALAEMYPESMLDRPDLDRLKGMTAGNGLHPDIVAGMFGFSSGDELVRAVVDAEPMGSVVEGMTDQRMLERYGDVATDEAIRRSADEAIHNEARGRFVATELKALQDATGTREKTGTAKNGRTISTSVMVRAAKQFAEQIVATRKVRDLKPGQHTRAETSAGKAAEKALRAGKTEDAINAKRDQLLNHYAAKAVNDAVDEVQRAVEYLKKFDREGTRKKLPPEYLDQIDKLLERVELREQTNRALDKRAKLADWIQSQEDIGIEPEVPDYVREDAQLKNYRQLTVEEFRGLVETIKQIEHLGRLKDKLLTAKDQREFAAIVEGINKSIVDNAGDREADTRTATTLSGKALQRVRLFGAAHIKAATYARVMDGNKDGGQVWEYLVRPANEAGDNETSMRADVTKKLADLLEPWLKGGKPNAKRFFPELKRSFTRQEALVIALNSGNEGNLQRLLGGEGWTAQQIQPVLQSLTAKDWSVVQGIWNLFESYLPQINAKEVRVFGRELKKVVPTPFDIQTADGQTVKLQGGYYPIKYDPAASARAEEHNDAEAARRQLRGAYNAATTRRSFTKARVEEVNGRPLLYDLSGVYSGFNDMIHDLAWHEWLIDTNRLLRAIDGPMRSKYGPEVVKQFRTWRDAIAEGDQGATDAVDMAIGRLRQSVSVAGLGFNVMSALMQPLGFTQSVVRIGARWVGTGMKQYVAAPIDKTREVNGKSAFMANRSRTRFRELNELRNRVQGQSTFKRVVNQNAYLMMMRVQQMVDVPTWLGAYEKAIAEGNDEKRAIALADQAVIDSQGGGQTKDLAAIERGSQLAKLFTTFYSFMNTAANLAAASKMGPDGKGRFTANMLLLTVVPAVLGSILKDALTPGDAGDDDPEKLAKKLAGEQLSYLLGLVVVGREFGEASRTMLGLTDRPRDYTGPAGLRAIADFYQFSKQAGQGEFDDAFRKTSINLMGDLLGLPSAQLNRTITGAKALSEGKTQNPAAVVMGFQEPR